MRRYMQGTLDFTCGVYAVINALSVIHNLDLAAGRLILAEALRTLSTRPALWQAFLRNETDHYWLVDYCLARWCANGRFRLCALRPFAPDPPLYETPEALLDNVRLFRPAGPGSNLHDPRLGPGLGVESVRANARLEADRAFRALELHLQTPGPRKAALFRFLRFLPGSSTPVVLHWTTAFRVLGESIVLHDASSEPGAIHALEKASLMPENGPALLYIEPESVTLLEPGA